MTEKDFYFTLLYLWFLLAAFITILLGWVAAPYGRHMRKGWGPSVESRVGWIVMEAPAALGMAYLAWVGRAESTWVTAVFFAAWQAHYVYRSFIYPFRRRYGAPTMPLSIVFMAVIFNTGNAYLNGRYLYAPHVLGVGAYGLSWLSDLRFWLGLGIFAAGLMANRQADRILRGLRSADERAYRQPEGGLFRWVSSPNYFGEIVQWIGWAVATWSLPGLAFAVWTIANLAPRAWSNHQWYLAEFPDYPQERRALIPGLW